MSVVIIGGNERMEQQYKQICKKHKCKAKVFTRMSGNLKTQIGQPDLIILFTSTVAHKMVHCALKEAERYNIRVERAHSSSCLLYTSSLASRREWIFAILAEKRAKNPEESRSFSALSNGSISESRL